jgi:hypothetical protein
MPTESHSLITYLGFFRFQPSVPEPLNLPVLAVPLVGPFAHIPVFLEIDCDTVVAGDVLLCEAIVRLRQSEEIRSE